MLIIICWASRHRLCVCRFEVYVRRWMKAISDLMLEGEQLRLETDDQVTWWFCTPLLWKPVLLICTALYRDLKMRSSTGRGRRLTSPCWWTRWWPCPPRWRSSLSGSEMTTWLYMKTMTLQPDITWHDMKWKQWHDAPSLILHYRAAKCKLLKSWHNLDVNVARYHFESCDNAKFLGAMEKYVHAIYLEVCYLFSIFNISILNLWIYCKGPNGHERSPEKTFKPCENDL